AHAARHDLAALGHELFERAHVLVVDARSLVHAELADLAAAPPGAGTHLSLFHGASLLSVVRQKGISSDWMSVKPARSGGAAFCRCAGAPPPSSCWRGERNSTSSADTSSDMR